MSDLICMDGDRTFETSNAVLALFADSVRIERRTNGWHVTWIDYYKTLVRRRWMTRGQDFYPVWSDIYPGGGTSTTAIAQLIRWNQHKPMLPLSSWKYWCGPKCRLGRDNGERIIEMLYAAEYPEVVDCVLCGNEIVDGLDWWSLYGVTGPCCGMSSGCKQVRTKAKKQETQP